MYVRKYTICLQSVYMHVRLYLSIKGCMPMCDVVCAYLYAWRCGASSAFVVYGFEFPPLSNYKGSLVVRATSQNNRRTYATYRPVSRG